MKKMLILILIIIFMSGCEQRTEVKLEGGNPPIFVLKGSGRLGEVIIFGPEQARVVQTDPFDETHVIWKIEPEQPGESNAGRLRDIRAITYGIVPRGYKQTKPMDTPPLALVPGKRSAYRFVTVNAPWGTGYFEIRDGKPVPVEGP
jgi:hypothetical protein